MPDVSSPQFSGGVSVRRGYMRTHGTLRAESGREKFEALSIGRRIRLAIGSHSHSEPIGESFSFEFFQSSIICRFGPSREAERCQNFDARLRRSLEFQSRCRQAPRLPPATPGLKGSTLTARYSLKFRRYPVGTRKLQSPIRSRPILLDGQNQSR